MKKRHTKRSRKTTAQSRISSTPSLSESANSAQYKEEPSYFKNEEQKLTKKQLRDLLAGCRFRLNAAQEREGRTLANLRQAHASLNEDRQKWLESTNRMKMDAKVTVIRASRAMIEALARMIGADGF